jgi:hypothetical protein
MPKRMSSWIPPAAGMVREYHVPNARRGLGQEEPKAQPAMEGRKRSRKQSSNRATRTIKPASLMLRTIEMGTPDDGGDGACFAVPAMLEFELLEQSAGHCHVNLGRPT